MYRLIFLLSFIFCSVSQANEIDLTRLKGGIAYSSALKDTLDIVASAYTDGPNFNGFFYSDTFSFFAVNSQTPQFSWVDPEAVIEHVGALIDDALNWESDEEVKARLENIRSQALSELQQI